MTYHLRLGDGLLDVIGFVQKNLCKNMMQEPKLAPATRIETTQTSTIHQ